MKHLDELIDLLGGFGRFQLVTVFGMFSCYFVTGFSMMQMTFAGLIPDWHCVMDWTPGGDGGQPGGDAADLTRLSHHDGNSSAFMAPRNGTFQVCSINGTECSSHLFKGSSQTIINEWDLVCGRAWIKQVATSLQMCGVLVGAVACGQLGDRFGRKVNLYAFLLEHTVINFITGLSVSWQMFAVCRFFIGIGLGGILVVIFPYSLEFFPQKWRAILACFPFFATGVAFFSLSAYLLDNWAYLHFLCAAVNAPYVLGWFYFPDSPRWLTVHGRLDEAVKGVEKIARMNRKPVPASTVSLLNAVAQEEREIRQSGKGYTYLDIFRGFKMAKISLSLSYIWMSLNVVYYGISFGVASLDGNLYLNIFLMAIMEIPIQFVTLYTNNKFGRRPSGIFFYVLSTVGTASCLIVSVAASEGSRGIIISVLALIAKMFIGGAWCVILLWGVELYPTVTRNLGYGLANTAARVGGIIAPFIINLDSMAVASYAIMTGLLFICILLCVITPETKGVALADSLAIDDREAGRVPEKTPDGEHLVNGEDAGTVVVQNGHNGTEKTKLTEGLAMEHRKV